MSALGCLRQGFIERHSQLNNLICVLQQSIDLNAIRLQTTYAPYENTLVFDDHNRAWRLDSTTGHVYPNGNSPSVNNCTNGMKMVRSENLQEMVASKIEDLFEICVN